MLDISKTIQAIASHICIEQGTSGIWTYRKYADGTLEQWGEYVTTGAISGTWGNAYTSGGKVMPDYAIPFVGQIPIVTAGGYYGNGDIMCVAMASNESLIKPPGLALIRPNAATVSASLHFYIRAIGKWK